MKSQKKKLCNKRGEYCFIFLGIWMWVMGNGCDWIVLLSLGADNNSSIQLEIVQPGVYAQNRISVFHDDPLNI